MKFDKMIRVNFYLTPGQIQKLKTMSVKLKVSIAEVIRCALETYLPKEFK